MGEKDKGGIGKSELHQRNMLRLVKALLLLAPPSEDLKLEDSQLSAAVKVEWIAESTLRVTGESREKTRTGKEKLEKGTTQQALWQLVEKTDTPLELPQRQGEKSSRTKQERQKDAVRNALRYLDDLGVFKDERPENKTNTRYWIFTLTLKHKDASIEENLGVVNQKLGLEMLPPTDKSIIWRDICRTMLEKQKQLTTNRLMRADEMLFDIDRIRVDLALVERKQTDKRSEDDNPQQSQLYKPDYEETQKLEYKEFLTKVLKSEQSKKVAIIGEPGAGKTTLLQRIAFWILDNTDDLPIWIPLGNFPNPAPKFKEYLLNDWLEDAIPSVTPKIKAEFEEQLMAGKVWLLLDGVDEMAAKSGSPLTVIANRIVGWCDRLRIVLTCRLNVWEANPYSLNGFQTYRTLEFSQEKVEEFIKACFQNRRGAQLCAPELGIQLQQALNQPGKERIKDLVRNPLRLTLLCSTWHLREGKLPDTKAELYQQFVEEVYRWQDKEKEVSTITHEETEQLNAKLKELAVAAIDNETNRFCLRQKFVEGVFGDSSLFPLALDVGWLNQVGVDAKNPHQPVYAFFHPTFQEYFAALAIADWDFFLPRAHDNQNPKPVSEKYRIFEPQWKEVILLWLGREEVAKEQKEDFIRALVEFEDRCGDFYGFRAFFLAAVGIAEFRNCFRADEIVAQIVELGFSYFKIEEPSWQIFINPIANEAKATLLQTDRGRVFEKLLDLFKITENEDVRRIAIEILGEISTSNQRLINEFVQILSITKNEDVFRRAIEILGKIAPGNKHTIEALVQILETTKNEDKRRIAAYSLWKIDPRNQWAIEALVRIVATNRKEHIRRRDVEILGEIGTGNQQAIEALIPLLETTGKEYIRRTDVKILAKIASGNQQAIEALARIVAINENENNCIIAAESLGKIDPGNQQAIEALVQILGGSIGHNEGWAAAVILGDILQNHQMPSVVSALQHCLADEVYQTKFDLFYECYKLIWDCAQNMTYPAFYQAWHQQEEVEKTTTPDNQRLNQADLPQSLQSAIANDPQLSPIIHLICIDGSQIIDPDRPPAEIYDQMLDQNCPECDRVPEKMPALKLYWNSLKRKSDKRVVLVFYALSTDTTSDEGTTLSCPYGEAFLRVLSKFGREICVITEQRFDHIPLKFFAPSQTMEDVVKWIREMVVEK